MFQTVSSRGNDEGGEIDEIEMIRGPDDFEVRIILIGQGLGYGRLRSPDCPVLCRFISFHG